jgi:hypothetical protein
MTEEVRDHFVYSVETIDWSADCIWDAWLRGIFSSKAKIDNHLVVWQGIKGEHKFRVLEIEVDTNIITGGWIVVAGEGKYEWREANSEDIKFMGR